MQIFPITRRKTYGVKVGQYQVGGGAPVVVQSMTNTDTADIAGTVAQCKELADAGSELVRITVNMPESAAAVAEIVARLRDLGCTAPIIGDFHYNGHVLLTKYPDCARALDKYRINPGNVGAGARRDEQFSTICKVAVDNGKPVRIGVNGGSLNQELVMRRMQENTDRELGPETPKKSSTTAWCSRRLNRPNSRSSAACATTRSSFPAKFPSRKTSSKCTAISRARPSSRCTWDSPKRAWAQRASCGPPRRLGILLQEGIGDTIRISLTPRPGGDRREEVYAACELLQSLGLRSFAPSVTACPGCGRTTSTTFQELAERIQDYIRESMPQWKQQYEGVEDMTLAVMGCIVNGPGESKAANIGISLPGTGEEPSCPVYIDGKKSVTLHGNYDELSAAFRKLVDDYIQTKYALREATSSGSV